MVASLSGALLSERLLGKFDRVRAYQWTIISFVIFGALIFFLPPSQVWLILASTLSLALCKTSPRRCSGPCSPMWSITKSIAAAAARTGWFSLPRCLPSNLGWRWVGRSSAGCLAWWITPGTGSPGAASALYDQRPVHPYPLRAVPLHGRAAFNLQA